MHQSFWNGGSICYILETFRTEVVLGRLYYLAIKPSSEAIVDSCDREELLKSRQLVTKQNPFNACNFGGKLCYDIFILFLCAKNEGGNH